jgi:hypothetical protein
MAMFIKAGLVALLAAPLLTGAGPTSGETAQRGRAAPSGRTPQTDRTAHAGPSTSPGRSARADGIRYTIPPDWRAARASLTPHLTNPREVLTVGTGALPVGGRCVQFPSAALTALGPSDALVTVQERLGSVTTFPARPRHFALPAPNTSEAADCAGPGASFDSYWFEFREGGRGFHVLVAFGPTAPAERRREALAVLDSLQITPRRPIRIDGDDAIPFDDASRGLHLVHASAWRVYEQTLTQAISGRDQISLGTFPLHQTKPDSNCTPATALRSRPPAGGLIFMYEQEGLNRTQLARVPPRPARLRLPRSSYRPYECFGPSWRVDFRDGGRAFTAHVYGPPARRREALAILDSLRVRSAPFHQRLHAAHFPRAPGWRTRVSEAATDVPSCGKQRVSWASTVPFLDGPRQLPPNRMIQALPPDGIIIALTLYTDTCARLRGIPALRPPLNLSRATRSGFPGPRGDDLPLYRILGRFPGHYNLDLWVFYGRRHPTKAQRAAAQRELSGVRWPAWL